MSTNESVMVATLEQFVSAAQTFLEILVGILGDATGSDCGPVEHWEVRTGGISVEVHEGRCVVRGGGEAEMNIDLRSPSANGRLSWDNASAVAEAFRVQLPTVDPRGESNEQLAEMGRTIGDGLEVEPTPDQLELLRAAWWWGS